MSVNFNIEVQSKNFGNGKSLSIEEFNVDIIDKQLK